MLAQIFKIMWHRKGKNFLLLVEIFFSFIVLFAVGTIIIESVRNYIIPTGFDYKDVYALKIERHGEEGQSAAEKLKQIKKEILSMPEVQSTSFSYNNIPYFSWDNGTTVSYPEGDLSVQSNIFNVEPSYFETLDIGLSSGRFFEKGDMGEIKKVVINAQLSQELFRDENPLGKRIRVDGQQLEVVGVVGHFRQHGEFSAPSGAIFFPAELENTHARGKSVFLIEIKSAINPNWQPYLVKKIKRVAGGWSVELDSLEDLRSSKAKSTLLPLIALGIICGFLIVNVALGLFGVLWQNITKRYGEIGIRRAMGATKSSVRYLVVGEVLVLATMGLSVGLLLAAQFPLLGVFNVETPIYLLAMLTSLITIYLLVIVCAWYPSRQASNIEPAEALHYE